MSSGLLPKTYLSSFAIGERHNECLSCRGMILTLEKQWRVLGASVKEKCQPDLAIAICRVFMFQYVKS